MLASRLTLVHGDYSPKNIFVFPGHVLTLDFEVAHFGDPAFDSAFCLNHLLLKAMNFAERAAAYLDAARSFWRTYTQRLAPQLAREIEVATVRELGCLLLARIDGKSKVEYITEEAIRDRVRHIARHILLKQETSLGSLFARVELVVAASS
jgi:5-methylthioribose kinase